MRLSRRFLLRAAPLLLAAGAPPAPPDDALAAIERRHGGRLGVFALDTGNGRTIEYRADERFLLCSTFKGVLAALVLQRIERHQDSLGAPVRFGRHDLIAHSPVTEAHVERGALPVEAMVAAILEQSDNAAANLLMRRVGGPPAVTAFLRRIGDPITRINSYEPVSERIGPRLADTTAPRAIAATARTLLLGDALGAESRARLEGWMRNNAVGRHRLRAAFPADWPVADRTGTADRACNDFAIVRPPNRAPLVIAAYYAAPGSDTDAQEAVLREAGSAVRDAMT